MKSLLVLLCSCLACFGQFDLGTGTRGLSVRVLGSSAATGNDDNESTGSYNPQANSMLIAFVVNTKAAAPDQPTAVGNSLTWNEIFDTNFLADHRLTVWQAKCGSGATAGAFTAATTGVSQTGWAVAVFEITGGVNTGTDGTNVLRQQVNASNNANTNVTTTFGTLGKGTLCLSMIAYNLNTAVMTTSEATWLKIANVNFNTPATAIAAFYQPKNADTTCLQTNAALFTGCSVGLEFVQEGNYP